MKPARLQVHAESTKFGKKTNWTPWYNDYQISSYDMDYVPWGSAPDTEFEKQDDNLEFLLVNSYGQVSIIWENLLHTAKVRHPAALISG